MATDTTLLGRCLGELGLVSLWRSPRDVKLLCLQRFVRMFAYGTTTLILVAFLRALGISRTRVGLFMTLTVAGDVAVSLTLTLFADRLGRRAVLAAGALLMTASGLVFALAPGLYGLLLAAAVVGVISPTGNEIGPFRAVEESTLAHLTTPAQRSDVYAWYSLLGTAGTAGGLVTCGAVVHHLSANRGWALIETYRLVFGGYAALGLIKLALALAMSRAAEVDGKPPAPTAAPSESTPLLNGVADSAPPRRRWIKALFPEVSQESVRVVASLSVLFALDAFASGLATPSWVTFFFRSHYNIEEGRLGSIFFVTSIISACSMLVASSLAKRFGNVNTMVFTHIPSGIFLAVLPLPSDVHLSLLFLILRSCTQSMDTAPRSAFVAAVILPQERTAVIGFFNVAKSTTQSLGPLITGVLADHDYFWVSFVCAGSLKVVYDLGLLALFKNHEREKADGELVEEEQRVESPRESDDEEGARESSRLGGGESSAAETISHEDSRQGRNQEDAGIR